MKNFKWLRCVAFVLLLTISLVGVMQCYSLPTSYDTRNLASLDAQENNTLDGIIIGTSVVSYAFLTPVAWRDYGMALFHMGASEQPFGVVTDYLDYILEKQDLKYVVVDIHGLRTSTIFSSIRDSKVKSTYLNFPDLLMKFKILRSTLDYAQDAYDFYGKPEDESKNYVDVEDNMYYFPFYAFHGRWVEGLKKADFVTVESKYLGAHDRNEYTFGVRDCTQYLDTWDYDDPGKIDAFQQKYLDELFAYGKEKNIEFLFISLPSFRSLEEQMELSALIDYCAENGYNTIDFSDDGMLEKANIDITKDFCNDGHLNSRGGIKGTQYICDYLIENGYYTPDHRGEETYSDWDEATEKYFKYYEKGWKEKESDK